ncbi:MAG: hypothetical protein H7X89_08775 [Rhizobiales bacterium]|nr:hypothetical protein [Hyphomicrobiales bacterium]
MTFGKSQWRMFSLALGLLSVPLAGTASAAPTSVSLAGSFQSEIGCSSDFNLGCSQTQLLFDSNDDAWERSITIPAGSYSYVVGINGGFDESYGLNTQRGVNIPLTLSSTQTVNFYYSDATKWVTDNVNSRIVTLASSFQSELGCAGDFQPSCLRTWLQDPNGDGIYTLTTDLLPAGMNSLVVTVGQSFGEVYGPGGVRNGGNINFTVDRAGMPITFEFTSSTNVLRILPIDDPPASVPEPPGSLLLATGLLGLLSISRRSKCTLRRAVTRLSRQGGEVAGL